MGDEWYHMGGVIAEFTIPAEDFAFGEALRTEPAMEITLERIVPTGDCLMPYIWVTAGDFEHFEAIVQEDPHVSALELIDGHTDHQHLYRVEWTDEVRSLTYGINSTDGVILHASGREVWAYQIRFPNHDKLRTFYDYLRERDIPLTLHRLDDLSERPRHDVGPPLTSEQREALLLAHQRGFFDVPRKTSLVDIATELGISDQACSERIRRGMDRLVGELVR